MKLALIFLFGVALTLAEDSNVLQEFAANNVHYIGNLYKELAKVHSENLLICPLSIQSLFALISGGARGETARQITSSLRIPEGEEKIKETYRRLGESLQVHDKYTASSANKIYVADGFNISEEYKTTAKKVFGSEIQNIDFTKTKKAVDEINQWVEQKTHDKIKDVVNEYIVDPTTIALFVNALYFQGTWVKKFSKVGEERFDCSSITYLPTKMMRIVETFNYYKSDKLKAKFLELPYEGNDITMTIVLPDEIEGLSSLEANIDQVLVAPKYSPEELEVAIPKFKIETTTELIPILQSLGIKDAFTGAADFSGIGENHDHLSISAALQKAFIEVDENGTTAAAATVVTMSRSGRQDEPNFIANHPFLFYLKHRAYGVFFVGRFAHPKSFITNKNFIVNTSGM